MLARRLTTTLPAITLPETIDTICTHSVTSLTGAHTTVVTARPCRAPHQTISDVGLIGGVPRADAGRSIAGPQWRALPG
jgi:magnesium chelatase family protein